MPGDVLLNEALLLRLDRRRPGGKLPYQIITDAGDLPSRVAIAAPRTHLPLHTQHAGEVIGQDRVVMLGQGHDSSMQGPAVHGAPLPVRGLHPVRDHHMRMQLRIPRTRIKMIERCRNHPTHVDLRDTVRARPCSSNIPFEKIDDLADSGVMRLADQCLGAAVGDSPQHGD